LPRTSGLHRGGKLQSLPLVSGQWSAGGFLVYNKALLAQAGYTDPPKTIEEYETYGTAITAKGGGKFFGAALSSGKPADINALQAQAGASSIGGGIDLRTGKVAYADQSLVDQVELLRRMQAAKVRPVCRSCWPTRAPSPTSRTPTPRCSRSRATATSRRWRRSSTASSTPSWTPTSGSSHPKGRRSPATT
jgi:ABC-type glycerol-3-phosphate transport system substrate-binding protein